MFRYCFPLLALVALLFRLDRIFYKQNESFCVAEIYPRCSWGIASTVEKSIPEVFDRPFHYLNKGNEFFVFQSEDNKYVIKFLRIPRCKHLDTLLKTFKIAAEHLPAQTGVVYAHTRPKRTGQTVQLVDRFRQKYFLEIGEIPFLIQKTGVPFLTALETAKNPEILIEKTLELFDSLYDEGFMDQDSIFEKNFGVVDDMPFIMDIGGILPKSPSLSRMEFREIMTVSLRDSLEAQFPHLLPIYKKCLHKNPNR